MTPPGFDHPVAPGGYAWWYVDALSDDGGFGLAAIGFIGSVFSPYYARARRRGHADPLDHCAINLALYFPGRQCWTMTERRHASVSRSASELVIGPSAMRWDGSGLRIDFDEVAAPVPRRVRGTVMLHPLTTVDRGFALEPSARHRWRPIAPCARVEVRLRESGLQWQGTGYFDANAGDAPLEAAFARWQWSRTHRPDQITAIAYDAEPRCGPPTAMALRIGRGGLLSTEEPGDRSELARTRWNLPRRVRTEPGSRASLVRSLEDGPFYARSLLGITTRDGPALAIHETLSLDRFAAGWVRALLPFRMRRARSTNS
jgi:carotenoid 1,2-hydratase